MVEKEKDNDYIYPLEALNSLSPEQVNALKMLEVLRKLEPLAKAVKTNINGVGIYLNFEERAIFIHPRNRESHLLYDSQIDLASYASYVVAFVKQIFVGINLGNELGWEVIVARYTRPNKDVNNCELVFSLRRVYPLKTSDAIALLRGHVAESTKTTVERVSARYREQIDAFKKAFKFKKNRTKFKNNFVAGDYNLFVLASLSSDLEASYSDLNVSVDLCASERKLI